MTQTLVIYLNSRGHLGHGEKPGPTRQREVPAREVETQALSCLPHSEQLSAQPLGEQSLLCRPPSTSDQWPLGFGEVSKAPVQAFSPWALPSIQLLLFLLLMGKLRLREGE